jgi:hypothetical protein
VSERGASRPAISTQFPELLVQAFKALPADASKREIGLVAKALLASEDEETLAILDKAAELGDAMDPLEELAVALGSGPSSALTWLPRLHAPARGQHGSR